MPTIPEALDTAVRHHQAGNLEAAEPIYRQILAAEPRHAPSWHLLGLIHFQRGQHAAALEHIGRAIALDANVAVFHSNLGNIYQALDRPAEAAASHRRSVELKPDYAEGHYNLALALEGLGQLDQAAAGYRRALELMPDLTAAHNALGNLHHGQGRWNEAVDCYLLAMAMPEPNAQFLNDLGIALAEHGKPDSALVSYGRALDLNPDFAEAHYNLANLLRDRQQLDAAAASYRRAIAARPDFAAAHNNLAMVLKDQDRFEEAVASYRRALELKPDYVEAVNNLGIAFALQDKQPAAMECFRRAIELKSDYAEAQNNLGIAFEELAQLEEAIGCFRRAIELKPDYIGAYNNLGIGLLSQGKSDEAIACYRRAIELQPDYAQSHCNLGAALKDQGKLDEAIACYRRAIELAPGHAAAYNNLGIALSDQGKLDEAAAAYRSAVEAEPDFARAIGSLCHELQQICHWPGLLEYAERVAEAVDAETASVREFPVSPFCFLVLPNETTAEQHLRCARQWVEGQLKPQAGVELVSAARPRQRKPKLSIGYLSADFCWHATAVLIAELIEKHDHERFEIVAYSFGRDDGGAMRQRLIRGFDRFVDVRDLSFAEAAQRIADDEIDILVDLKGFTQEARTQIVMQRPAPIQVSYLGYPGTMGASFIDYILVDDFVVPTDQQPYYAERLVHLPGCYQVNDSQRTMAAKIPSRADCGLPAEGFVFCSFNNNYKITPSVYDTWMRLLTQLPGSVLWLLESNRFSAANLRREAAARGVAPDRLVFAPRQGVEDHLARHRLADLFLDNVPVNAHTTASEALWAGCPVLSIAGATFAARVAGSLLRAVGLPDLITSSLAEYEALALRLAREPEYLAGLTARLRANRDTGGLFDGQRFARNLERAYETMWEIYAAGQQPRTFRVDPAQP